MSNPILIVTNETVTAAQEAYTKTIESEMFKNDTHHAMYEAVVAALQEVQVNEDELANFVGKIIGASYHEKLGWDGKTDKIVGELVKIFTRPVSGV